MSALARRGWRPASRGPTATSGTRRTTNAAWSSPDRHWLDLELEARPGRDARVSHRDRGEILRATLVGIHAAVVRAAPPPGLPVQGSALEGDRASARESQKLPGRWVGLAGRMGGSRRTRDSLPVV